MHWICTKCGGVVNASKYNRDPETPHKGCGGQMKPAKSQLDRRIETQKKYIDETSVSEKAS